MTRADRHTASMKPITRDRFGLPEARHLLRRAGFGGTTDQVRTLLEWGPEKSVDHLLDHDSAMDALDLPEDWQADIMPVFTDNQRRQFQRARRMRDEEAIARFRQIRTQKLRQDHLQIRDMESWWFRRLVQSPYPLIEKMTLFWHGHFASSHRKVENSWNMFEQNMFFRHNAIGSFEVLLRGIIRDPAMLRYLDNAQNVAGAPNENLAREIMELFALGSGYTEDDIKEGARALTGYAYDGNDFLFRPRVHDNGSKRIFGQRGNYDGDEFVRLILTRRECPRFIVRNLYSFFVAEIPAPRDPGGREARLVLTKLARTMLTKRYVIKPVLRELFLSEHFYSAPVRHRLIKSPMELVAGTIRTLGTPLRQERALLDAANRMGQRLFHPPSVQGWVGGRSWINTATLFERQNTAAYLCTGIVPGRTGREPDPMRTDHLLKDLAVLGAERARNPEHAVPHLCDLVLGELATEKHERAVASYLRAHDNQINDETLSGALAVLTASPEYQLA